MSNKNKQNEELLKETESKDSENKQNETPPTYIIKLIQTWYKDEYLHLIEYSWHSKSHWKIKLDDILNNTL